MPSGDFITDHARVYGIDLATERLDPDGVRRADICPPKVTGHWEWTDMGWVHIPAPVRPTIGDIWARGNL